jgi:hypothetical protein
MSKDYKDIERYSDVHAYLKNDLSEHERKLFEKIIEEDSFIKEAIDGLSLLSAEELDHDFKSFRIKKAGTISGVKVGVIMFVFVVIIAFAAYWWFFKPKSEDKSFENGSSSYSDEPIPDKNSLDFIDSSEVFFIDDDTLDASFIEQSGDSIASMMNNVSEKPVQEGDAQRKSDKKNSVEKEEEPNKPKPRRATEVKMQVEKIDTLKKVDDDSIYPLMNRIEVEVGHSTLMPETKNLIANPNDSLSDRGE